MGRLNSPGAAGTHEEVEDRHVHHVQQASPSVVGRGLLHFITVIRVHLPPAHTRAHYLNPCRGSGRASSEAGRLLGFLAFVVRASPGVSPGLTLGQVQVRQESCQGALDLVRLTAQGVLGGAVVRALAVETNVIG